MSQPCRTMKRKTAQLSSRNGYLLFELYSKLVEHNYQRLNTTAGTPYTHIAVTEYIIRTRTATWDGKHQEDIPLAGWFMKSPKWHVRKARICVCSYDVQIYTYCNVIGFFCSTRYKMSPLSPARNTFNVSPDSLKSWLRDWYKLARSMPDIDMKWSCITRHIWLTCDAKSIISYFLGTCNISLPNKCVRSSKIGW